MNRSLSNPALRRSALAWTILGGLGAAGVAWSEPRAAELFQNSLGLAAFTVAMSVPLGTLLGLLVARSDLPGRRIAACLLAILVFLPLYLQAAAWEAGFGKAGWFTLTAGDLEDPWLHSWRGARWVHSVAAVGWVALIVAAGALHIEPELEEQAAQDAGWWRVVWFISLRRILAYIAIAAIWVSLWTLGEMTVTDVYLIRTYAEEIYTGFALGDTLAGAWEHAVPLMLLVIAVSAAAFLSLLHLAELHTHLEASERPGRPVVWRLGKWRVPAAGFVALLLALLVLLPLANLVWQAGFTVLEGPQGPQRVWSWQALIGALGNAPKQFAHEMLWTLSIGVLGATCCTLLAGSMAWFARREPKRAWTAFALAAILLAIPAPLVGLSLIRFFDVQPFAALTTLYRRSLLGPVLGVTLRSFPFLLLLLWLAFRSLADEPLDQARLDGAGFWARLFRVACPQRRRAISLAWIAALGLASGDLATVILARPVGVTPASVRLFQLAHYGIREQEAALGLMSSALAIALAAIALRMAR